MALYFIRFSSEEGRTWETKYPDTLEQTRKLYKSLKRYNRRFKWLVEKADHTVLPEEEWCELDDLYDFEYDLDFDKIEIVEF